ncbi:MAG: hypothetical protein AB7J35_04625 [Dehalococcoidia bacterium]
MTAPRGQEFRGAPATLIAAILLTLPLAIAGCGGGKSEDTQSPAGAPLSPTLQQVLEDDAALRGLPAPSGIKAATIPRDQVREVIAGMLSDEDRRAFRQLTALYRLMGLIGPNDDYEGLYLDFASRAVIGFYAPEDVVLRIVDEDQALDFASFSPILQSTVAHELVHAIQDDHFELGGPLRRAAADPDWSLALSAAIEGDAVHYERLWGAKHLAGQAGGVPGEGLSGAGIPAALERELRFPYESGIDWVNLKGALDGNAATNGVLEGRRITTAEILHPDLLDNWQSSVVELPDISSQLGSSWKREFRSSFGEFRLRNLLQLHLTGLAAIAGATGWSGDQVALYSHGGESVAVLEVAFDTTQNADEFMTTMDAWLKAANATSSGNASTLPDGHGFAIRRAAPNAVIFAFASTPDLAKRTLTTQ